VGDPHLHRTVDVVTLTAAAAASPGALRVVERNGLSYRRLWLILASGLFEPVFYLLGLGVGLGQLVGEVQVGGEAVRYAAFVAPGLLASSAMNGALFDSTYNFFYKLKYGKTFDAMLVTPLSMGDVVVGEIAWAMLRGGFYAATFLLVMLVLGLVGSWWALLTVPAALVIGLTFAAVGSMVTSFVRAWQDFELVQLVITPLFLLSTSFFPLSVYPGWAQPLVAATPLFHGVQLVRHLTLGAVGWIDLVHLGYLLAVGLAAAAVTKRRLHRLLLG
jgi:lipooligosaccharide transport system permease protein